MLFWYLLCGSFITILFWWLSEEVVIDVWDVIMPGFASFLIALCISTVCYLLAFIPFCGERSDIVKSETQHEYVEGTLTYNNNYYTFTYTDVKGQVGEIREYKNNITFIQSDEKTFTHTVYSKSPMVEKAFSEWWCEYDKHTINIGTEQLIQAMLEGK